jgi:hypothetical protein
MYIILYVIHPSQSLYALLLQQFIYVINLLIQLLSNSFWNGISAIITLYIMIKDTSYKKTKDLDAVRIIRNNKVRKRKRHKRNRKNLINNKTHVG